MSLMHDFLLQKERAENARWPWKKIKNDHKGNCSVSNDPGLMFYEAETLPGEGCSHSVTMWELNGIKGCVNGKKKYKEKFIAPIPSCTKAQAFLDMLLINYEIYNHVKEQK